MSTEVIYRPARPDDVAPAAALMEQAGGDVLRFVLDEIAPAVDVRDLLAHMFAGQDNECSHKHCIVAETGGAIVGVVNAFPTELLKDMPDETLSVRERHLKARTKLKDDGSYRLNMIAVDPGIRRRGIASGLLRGVHARAMAEGYRRVSLHVWADNEAACSFYRASGFEVIGHAAVAWHPDLPHAGGSLLMRRML